KRFELVNYANHRLRPPQTLTIKPHDFYIKARLRPGRTVAAPAAAARPTAGPAVAQPAAPPLPAVGGAPPRPPAAPSVAPPTAPPLPAVDGHHTPLLVLYGSNLGTAEAIAHAIAQD